MFISISLDSSKLLIWLIELVNDVDNMSAYDNSTVELFTWSFKSKLKLGPLTDTVSLNIIGSSSNVTLYATGSSTIVLTHNVVFKSYESGNGSYSLINMVGLFGSSLSNNILLDITY